MLFHVPHRSSTAHTVTEDKLTEVQAGHRGSIQGSSRHDSAFGAFAPLSGLQTPVYSVPDTVGLVREDQGIAAGNLDRKTADSLHIQVTDELVPVLNVNGTKVPGKRGPGGSAAESDEQIPPLDAGGRGGRRQRGAG